MAIRTKLLPHLPTELNTVNFAGGFLFIISTGVKNEDPATRKMVRSHAMIGKNRGKSRSVPQKPHMINQTTNPQADPDAAFVIPRKVGSDLSLIRFADSVDPTLVEVVLKCKLMSTL